MWRVSVSGHCACPQNWSASVRHYVHWDSCTGHVNYRKFCKYAMLQIIRFTISRHWLFSSSHRKLGQVTVSRNSLFSHRILLYSKASEVKRQEIFFLLQRGFIFCSNRRPTLDAKKKPTSSSRLRETYHQKPVWWERLLVSYQYAATLQAKAMQVLRAVIHGNLLKNYYYLPAHCSFLEVYRSNENVCLDTIWEVVNKKSQSVPNTCHVQWKGLSDSCGYPA